MRFSFLYPFVKRMKPQSKAGKVVLSFCIAVLFLSCLMIVCVQSVYVIIVTLETFHLKGS